MYGLRGLALGMIVLVATAAVPPTARPEAAIPGFWDARERPRKPDMSFLPRLRFLTTVDFEPFNFINERGRLVGFHVDLARAICAVLEIEDRCQIQALPWEELDEAVENGQGEAIIAGIAVTSERRETYRFTRSYMQFPARFAMRKATATARGLRAWLAGRRVGVLDDTAHELFLRDFFGDVRVVTYTRAEWLLGDLRDGKIDAAFGDGMRLSFWLAGEDSQDCCDFAGGPLLAPEYLGRGLAIAVPRGEPELAEALDYALQEVERNGTFAELYLRYFPISFY